MHTLRLKSDIELMALVKEGPEGEAAFTVLMERHLDRVLNYLFRLVGHREESEDLSQQVFLRLYLSARSYQPTAKFSTFLFTIATNCAKSSFKRTDRRIHFKSWDEPLGLEGHTLSEVIPSPEASPLQQYMTKERVERIQGALYELPRDLYLVFTLSEDEGLSYQEIAKIVSIPVGTVASRKHTAVKLLREKLADLREEIFGGRP